MVSTRKSTRDDVERGGATLMNTFRATKPRLAPAPAGLAKADSAIAAPAPVTTTVAKKESKFHPLPTPSTNHTVPVVDGKVPRGASILIIQDPWINLLLDGHKTLEIRGTLCKKPAGEHVYLALSGGGGIILGRVTFVQCHGPLSRAEYAERSARHRVAGSTLPYGGSTFAWEFRAPVRFRQPVPYLHKPGVVIWAKKD